MFTLLATTGVSRGGGGVALLTYWHSGDGGPGVKCPGCVWLHPGTASHGLPSASYRDERGVLHIFQRMSAATGAPSEVGH